MLTGESDINPYLQQEVMSASPARLRWMLIQRATDLCGIVSQHWREGRHCEASQWLLRIREILGELLDGVKDESNPLSATIADFYLFLLQLSAEIERTQAVDRLSVLRDLLQIEADTWRLYLEKQGSDSIPATHSVPLFPHFFGALDAVADGSFSFEV